MAGWLAGNPAAAAAADPEYVTGKPMAIRISFITEDVGNRPPMLTEGRKRTQHAEVLSGVKPFRWTPKRKSGVESNYCTYGR